MAELGNSTGPSRYTGNAPRFATSFTKPENTQLFRWYQSLKAGIGGTMAWHCAKTGGFRMAGNRTGICAVPLVDIAGSEKLKTGRNFSDRYCTAIGCLADEDFDGGAFHHTQSPLLRNTCIWKRYAAPSKRKLRSVHCILSAFTSAPTGAAGRTMYRNGSWYLRWRVMPHISHHRLGAVALESGLKSAGNSGRTHHRFDKAPGVVWMKVIIPKLVSLLRRFVTRVAIKEAVISSSRAACPQILSIHVMAPMVLQQEYGYFMHGASLIASTIRWQVTVFNFRNLADNKYHWRADATSITTFDFDKPVNALAAKISECHMITRSGRRLPNPMKEQLAWVRCNWCALTVLWPGLRTIPTDSNELHQTSTGTPVLKSTIKKSRINSRLVFSPTCFKPNLSS